MSIRIISQQVFRRNFESKQRKDQASFGTLRSSFIHCLSRMREESNGQRRDAVKRRKFNELWNLIGMKGSWCRLHQVYFCIHRPFHFGWRRLLWGFDRAPTGGCSDSKFSLWIPVKARNICSWRICLETIDGHKIFDREWNERKENEEKIVLGLLVKAICSTNTVECPKIYFS